MEMGAGSAKLQMDKRLPGVHTTAFAALYQSWGCRPTKRGYANMPAQCMRNHLRTIHRTRVVAELRQEPRPCHTLQYGFFGQSERDPSPRFEYLILRWHRGNWEPHDVLPVPFSIPTNSTPDVHRDDPLASSGWAAATMTLYSNMVPCTSCQI
ncbi:hypothetical protein DL89DRAFT_121179 [Linderina pennispora]|uniref:Uncharacterized protein n=1 Tax=Linderina pennispora TaxID=61395 RepID=A0A1Y1WCB8_9FUNG|nr:uncharacterized protein DL89DRAFT_121179 [Linderina pennispora]ORX71179.1 hypothetical protein DL89DRAFT_121179 [Linderina pennispora]